MNDLNPTSGAGYERPANNWKTASAILGVLFLGALVFGIAFYSKYKTTANKATDLGTQLDQTRTTLEGELASLNTAYGTQIALNDTLSADLQEKIAEVEDLKVRIAKARKDLKSSQAKTEEIKGRLAQMEELKIALERDIVSLKEENQVLASSNQQLNTELVATKDEVSTLNNQVMSLTQANEKLTSRLKILAPAGFRADNFTVTSATKRDKITSKGKKIDEITVTFDLNNIPEEFQGNREIYLVLTEFNGNPVAVVPGKDVNLKFGNEPVSVRAADLEKVSLKARQSMTMSFEPTDDMTPGTYNLMVYADNGYLGSTGFMVSK
jgi:predicted RNase H-like nuclease (RuvC/YqgF family)